MERQDQMILVTGAAGHQGGAVARRLLQRGFFVRAFVRHPEKPQARDLAEAGAEVVPGDFDDRASLDRALKGADGVFAVQTPWDAGIEGEIRQGKAVADAAWTAGVQHFVYSSVGSADQSTGIPHFDSKWQIEEHICDLDLPYTIFRPVFFYSNYDSPPRREAILGGTLSQPLRADTKLQQLSEEDYSEMVATAFENPDRFLGRTIDVASSEPTMLQVAETFSRVLGRSVRYQQVPWAQFEQEVGRELTVMYHWFEEVGYRADLAALRREFGDPTDLETYLREHAWERAGRDRTGRIGAQSQERGVRWGEAQSKGRYKKRA